MYHCKEHGCATFFRIPDIRREKKVCPFCKSANIEALPICEICGRAEDLNDLFVCEKCNDIITVEMAFAVANIQKQTGADKEVIINKIKEMYKE